MNNIDQIMDIFLNWQALLQSIAIFIVVGLVRNLGIEKVDGKLVGYGTNHWFKRFLPLYPYLLSIGFCMLPKSPLPEVVNTYATRLLFGIYTGWLSGFSYQLFKSMMTKAGVKVEEPVADKPVDTTEAPKP